jgi:hypothetical protein
MSDEKNVRSSQLISPFGPGAIVDIGDESLLMTDLKGWPKNLLDVSLPRLATELGVSALKSPPKKKDRGTTPAYQSIQSIRFPGWMFCPKCRGMENWSPGSGRFENGKPVCKHLKCSERALVPMRFVMACENGHMDDVPWDYWAHSGPKGNRNCDDKRNQLEFRSNAARGSGLDALSIRCTNSNCGSSRDLGSITAPLQLQQLGIKCNGRQPWEKMQPGSCDASPRVLQRGASNLYFPVVRSALDIPVAGALAGGSDLEAAVSGHMHFESCKDLVAKEQDAAASALAQMIASDNECSADDVLAIIKGDLPEPGNMQLPSDEQLKAAEWEVLSSVDVVNSLSKNFVARVEPDLPTYDRWGISKLIERVVLLDKLREVRAFCGYERVDTNGQIVPPAGQHESIKWLPAIEVFGEGIFLQLNQNEIEGWKSENKEFSSTRLATVVENYNKRQISYLSEPTLELLTLHTLAHLLIRQLSFECGYSSGSIRERIYAAPGQAGVLIYTADSDSEGSLGGLVQQGESRKILATIAAALETACWCSNDPVCSEMEMQGVMGLNKAACHSCTLVSETSCTMNNLMLDRKLLIGTETESGLFSEVLASVRADTGGSLI